MQPNPNPKDSAGPSEMGDTVLGLLEELDATQIEMKRITRTLGKQFERMMAKTLAIGAIINIRSVGPGYRGKPVRGRAYGDTFRIEGKFHVTVDPAFPVLSTWQVAVISYHPTTCKTIGNPLVLQGPVFPMAFLDKNIPEHNYIVAQVHAWESSQNEENTVGK